ncbi:MAG: hypothetical protein FJ303_22515 [Planctomycetes bacterium]|nr:hypothetical protein [Planctomycetota bacterium]
MSEPTLPPPSAGESSTYQPISGWAVAGLGSGIVFAFVVVASAAIAFFQGAPFFFPEWVLGLPLAGMAVSYYGRVHVDNSEGTLAGSTLASWGLRLNLVSAIVYFAYFYFTGLAIQGQANDFVMEMKDDDTGFFHHLLAGANNRTRHNAAFLLTQSPNSRGIRPENERDLRERYDKPSTRDGSYGILTAFRERESLPRVLYKQRSEDVTITPGTVRKWLYEKRSYRVERVYHVKTKEIEFDYKATAVSVEAEGPGQSRKWFINLMESHQIEGSKTLTRFGEGLELLRGKALSALQQHLVGVREGKPFPNWESLAKKQDWTQLAIDPPSKRDERQAQFEDMLAARGELKMHSEPSLEAPPDLPGRWEQVDGKVRVAFVFKATISKAPQALPLFMFSIVATLETVHQVDPAKVAANSSVDWRVVDLDVVAVHAVIEKK